MKDTFYTEVVQTLLMENGEAVGKSGITDTCKAVAWATKDVVVPFSDTVRRGR
jgi:hypothetical protein